MSRANTFKAHRTRPGISAVAGRVENVQTNDIEERNTKNEDIKAENVKDEDDNDTIKDDSDGEPDDGGVVVKDEDDVVKEEDDVSLDRAILDQIKELTDRVDTTLAEEDRCWYELESPHCRNRRTPFILKVRLDTINSIKYYQIKELLEVVKEVSVHYADAIVKVAELKQEVSELKSQLEIKEKDYEVKDEDSDVDMDKDNSVQIDVQSVADSIDGLSLMA